MIKTIQKLTDFPWMNLFKAYCTAKDGSEFEWMFVSRKKEVSIEPDNDCDAIMIVPIHIGEDGIYRIVLIEEYRVPLRAIEVGCPAGLHDQGTFEKTIGKELKEETGLDLYSIFNISPPLYSSAGLTDESCRIAWVTCKGELSTEHLENTEDIKAKMYTKEEAKELSKRTDIKFGAKGWLVIDSFINSPL